MSMEKGGGGGEAREKTKNRILENLSLIIQAEPFYEKPDPGPHLKLQ